MKFLKQFLFAILAINVVFSPYIKSSPDSNDINSKLVAMAKADVEVRKVLQNMSERKLTDSEKIAISENDKKNTKALKKILQNNGWDITSNMSKKGLSALFLILQHSTHDTEFQKESLIYIQELYSKEKILGQQLALLTDRIRISQGKQQLYGTQADIVNNEIIFKTIEDVLNVDRRRQQLKMPPLEFYKKILEESYGLKEHGLIDN